MKKTFEIRTFGFWELAQLYFQNVTKASASRMFRQWIYNCPKLVARLTEMDWNKRAKYFTPKQVNVLVGYFDPPF